MGLIQCMQGVSALFDEARDMARYMPKGDVSSRWSGVVEVPGLSYCPTYDLDIYPYGKDANTVRLTLRVQVKVKREESK